jgi:hypothetical protein
MLGVIEDFEGPREVEQVHIVVHGEKNLDGFILLAPNCTHLAG